MFSGSFQKLLNTGGLPSGLTDAVAGYGVDRDAGALTTPAQRMQREAEIQKLEFDMLKGRQEGKDNLIRGIGTSLVSNQMIPGMAIGNMQGLVAQGQGNQIFPIIKQKIPAVTLDGGKTYFDPRDGSPIDMNSLQPKDFFTDFGQGVKAIKEAKEKGGTYMNEETRKMMEMLEGS